jgi:hypothetical protein
LKLLMLLFKIANLFCLRSSLLTFQLAAGSGSVSNSVAQPATQKQKALPKPNDGAATAPAPAPVAHPQKKQKTAAAKPKIGRKTKASTELICGCVEYLQRY